MLPASAVLSSVHQVNSIVDDTFVTFDWLKYDASASVKCNPYSSVISKTVYKQNLESGAIYNGGRGGGEIGSKAKLAVT